MDAFEDSAFCSPEFLNRHLLTQCPIVALPLRPALPGDLLEALVEAEVVPDGVLPALGLELAVVGEVLADVVVDLAELELPLAAVLDGHGDHGNVAVRGLRVGV